MSEDIEADRKRPPEEELLKSTSFTVDSQHPKYVFGKRILSVRTSDDQGSGFTECFNTTISAVAGIIVLDFISLCSLIIAAIYFNSCRGVRLLPITMIITSVLSLIHSFLDLTLTRLRVSTESQTVRWTHKFFMLAHVGLFIFLCVLVYGSLWPEFADDKSRDYCNPFLFYFEFWLLNVILALVAVVALAACCFVVFARPTFKSLFVFNCFNCC